MSNPAIMIYVPFALNGNKNIIQVTRQENQDQEDATWSTGYPDITMIKQSAGGKAPKGLDMNGVLYSLSADIVHRQSGKQMLFDAEYATNIGGYAKGSLLQSTDLSTFWISTVDGNTTDPDSASSSGWNRFAYTPVATSTTTGTVKLVNSLDSTATDAALTAAQGNVLLNKLLGVQSKKGYQWVNGTLFQWGVIELKPNTTTDVPLSVSFPNSALTSYCSLGSLILQGYTYTIGSDIYTNKITITLLSSYPQVVGVRWFAIGS